MDYEAIERMFWKKRSYQRLFLKDGKPTPEAKVILADLKAFCRGGDYPSISKNVAGTVDPYEMAVREGRREVWRRITEALYLDESYIINLREEYPHE